MQYLRVTFREIVIRNQENTAQIFMSFINLNVGFIRSDLKMTTDFLWAIYFHQDCVISLTNSTISLTYKQQPYGFQETTTIPVGHPNDKTYINRPYSTTADRQGIESTI